MSCKRQTHTAIFLLSPLREGRRVKEILKEASEEEFLLSPLREGRLTVNLLAARLLLDFYSRPCVRGDADELYSIGAMTGFLLSPLREGRLRCRDGV